MSSTKMRLASCGGLTVLYAQFSAWPIRVKLSDLFRGGFIAEESRGSKIMLEGSRFDILLAPAADLSSVPMGVEVL